MKSNDSFPSSSIVDWYVTTESMLADVLRVIPYCVKHKNVWSPKLVTILQDTCSQLDSLWFYEAKGGKGRQLNIKDYFEYFGASMGRKCVVFWGEEVEKIQPFKPWAGLACSGHKKQKYNNSLRLDWWKSYQNVKHNRIKNRHEATLERTVNAAAALFLAILRCRDCRDAILQKEWLSWNQYSCDPRDCLDEDFGMGKGKPFNKFNSVVAETQLFSYPVGWSGRKIENFVWQGNASYRFMKWFREEAGVEW